MHVHKLAAHKLHVCSTQTTMCAAHVCDNIYTILMSSTVARTYVMLNTHIGRVCAAHICRVCAAHMLH